MRFGQALEELLNGKRIKRDGWNQPVNSHLILATAGSHHKFIAVVVNTDVITNWLPGQSDLLADDWVIVE